MVGACPNPIDACCSAASSAIEQGKKLHNLIDGTDLAQQGCTGTTSNGKLSPTQSRDLLRRLLQLYDQDFHPDRIPTLSGLECYIAKTGHRVWATPDEIQQFPGQFDLPGNNANDTTRLPTRQYHVRFHQVSGLAEWDWRRVWIEWRLVVPSERENDEESVITCGKTPESDSTKEPAWADAMSATIPLSDLKRVVLQVGIKRRSRTGLRIV